MFTVACHCKITVVRSTNHELQTFRKIACTQQTWTTKSLWDFGKKAGIRSPNTVSTRFVQSPRSFYVSDDVSDDVNDILARDDIANATYASLFPTSRASRDNSSSALYK